MRRNNSFWYHEISSEEEPSGMAGSRCLAALFVIFFIVPIVSFLLLLGAFFYLSSGDNPYTTEALVKAAGYPYEAYDVTTDDGYIIQIHRIPRGRDEVSEKKEKKVVLVQPGMMMDSACFVSMLPEQSLGFILANANLDVWLGNTRGTAYGRRHTTRSVDEPTFWDWSWETVADHELPAIIDFVLNATGSPHLYYVGNSQSGLVAMALLSTRPDYNHKIRGYYAMAPAGSLSRVKGPLKDITPIRHLVNLHDELSGPSGVFHRGRLNGLLRSLCKWSFLHSFCERIFYHNGGPPSNQLNYTQLPIFYSNYPDGSSTKNNRHFSQMMVEKRTARFDYGPRENMRRYGTLHSPSYNFSRISVPMYLWYSPSDALVGEEDVVEELVPQLQSNAVKQLTSVPDYNHFDFHWGLRAGKEIYTPIAELIVNAEEEPSTEAPQSLPVEGKKKEKRAAAEAFLAKDQCITVEE